MISVNFFFRKCEDRERWNSETGEGCVVQTLAVGGVTEVLRVVANLIKIPPDTPPPPSGGSKRVAWKKDFLNGPAFLLLDPVRLCVCCRRPCTLTRHSGPLAVLSVLKKKILLKKILNSRPSRHQNSTTTGNHQTKSDHQMSTRQQAEKHPLTTQVIRGFGWYG